jgi:ribosome-associated protein
MNETLLQLTHTAIDDKRGEDIVVLNMQGISLLADYFVIAEGGSERQVQAIAREIKEKAEEAGYTVRKIEGFDTARWILVDIGDVVAHIFHKDERGYYNLERLWGDAPTLDVPQV